MGEVPFFKKLGIFFALLRCEVNQNSHYPWISRITRQVKEPIMFPSKIFEKPQWKYNQKAYMLKSKLYVDVGNISGGRYG